MATLLYAKVGDEVVQRCDAKCYDASTKVCNCCCGGKNHGVGKAKAMHNVREQFGTVADILVEYGGIEVTIRPENMPWPKKAVASAPVWDGRKKFG